MASYCNAARSRRSTGAWTGTFLAKALGSASIAILAVAAILISQLDAWAAADDDYKVSVGDVVSFDFIDDALPAEQLTVASDGAINIPLIGSFEVGGLTVPDALSRIRKAFIERELFNDPHIALAVVSFRPIFVLGDVKAPGSFPYQPALNVEQAVALAGGQSTGGATAEDRVVTRARLRGALDESVVEIAKEAVAAARIKAQLANSDKISELDLPAKIKGLMNANLLATLLPTEQRILEADQHALTTRRKQLSAGIEEVNVALANVQQLSDIQKTVIASAQADLDRIRGLNKKGLVTITDLSNAEREATTQQSHLLEIYNQASTVRRELSQLQRDLDDATQTWTHTALTDLQAHNSEIERLIAVRESTEEQILLLSSLAAEQTRSNNSITFTYQIRRKVNGQTATKVATLDDPVAAGDTILVSINRLDSAQDTTSRSATALATTSSVQVGPSQ
ncbi:polysaccharide biosynthesis/export family protein [Mesorhizobium sp. B261B1A]|uniref:polysaccharide biosynthesis/export family protein n=1 Tax=Mesorhizobium sp. B261B1A TaxID=2876671 RepID=UPI001CD15A48|nr:polysaccharide biosynthesis/export family protein [Mesorhizobium sp. B261B1A]MCA0056629.1 polysaccharide biosynthesis/export family protein [Mesorhizobium sp. B261B1A]